MKAFFVFFAALIVVSSAVIPIDASAQSTPAEPTSVPVTPLLSARRFPGSLQTGSDPELLSSVEQYLSKVNGSTCAIVEQDGRVIVDRAGTEEFAPASLMKLATAIAALDILGPDHVFTTRFLAEGPVEDGVINGDLYVVGGGDPLLTTPGYKSVFDNPDQFYEDFSVLADTLADAGVTEVTGDLIGDESRYENVRWIPTWPSRYQIGGTVAPLSALIVNDGSTGFTETPNASTTNRRAGDPPLLFVQTLKTLLAARGITVSGSTKTGKAPSEKVEVAAFDSVPLPEVLAEMLLDSDNTTAELVTREVGLAAKGQGTTAAGIEALRESLTKQGFDLNGFVMLDGSGLDTGNRMSCSLAISLFTALSSKFDLSVALPLGGRSGTLRKRMLATASTGRVRAKTGTLNSVNALTGIATTPQGTDLTFAFLHNGNDSRTTGVADGFTDRLMTYAKGSKIGSLGPLPPK